MRRFARGAEAAGGSRNYGRGNLIEGAAMSAVTRRTAALAGITIAPLWLGVTALLTWLQWDYIRSVGWSPATANEVPYPSVLLRGDLGLVQSVNFVVTGVLVAVFALGLRR